MKTTTPLHRIRIGTIVPFNRHTPEYLQQILLHGFESFQLSCSTEALEMDLAREAGRIHAVLEGSGAVISSLFHGGNPMGEEERDEASRETLRRLIDSAHLFGSDLVCAFTGRVRGASIPHSIPRYVEVWRPLADQAAARGVRLAFENCSMGGTWHAGDWNIAHSPAAWELMFEALPDVHVGLEWEPCHQMLLLMDPIPQLRAWAKRLFHIHGKDATIDRALIAQYGLESGMPWGMHRTPGFGDSDWTRIIGDLMRFGFKGSIDIEGWHDPVYVEDLEMTGQVHALKYLKQCRGSVYVPNPVVG